jgi:acyl carrier protein
MDQHHNEIEKIILGEINSCLEMKDLSLLKKIPLEKNVFEGGLDSMDFAIIVSELEEKLGYDPFILEDDPVYPETFKDFMATYFKYSNNFVQKN